MTRWSFVGVMVLTMAVLLRFTPVAYADGCEGGDASAGHHTVAFGCDNGKGNGGSNNGTGNCKSEWVVSNHSKFAVR